MDLTALSLTELKSLAYEHVITLQQVQANLKTIEEQIKNRLEQNLAPEVQEEKVEIPE